MKDEPADRTKLTFSQAEGLAPLPRQLKQGELPKECRAALYEQLYRRIIDPHSDYINDMWEHILYRVHVFHFHQPADLFSVELRRTVPAYKDVIFEGKFNEIFDLFQEIMRDDECPDDFCEAIEGILRLAGYSDDHNDRV